MIFFNHVLSPTVSSKSAGFNLLRGAAPSAFPHLSTIGTDVLLFECFFARAMFFYSYFRPFQAFMFPVTSGMATHR